MSTAPAKFLFQLDGRVTTRWGKILTIVVTFRVVTREYGLRTGYAFAGEIEPLPDLSKTCEKVLEAMMSTMGSSCDDSFYTPPPVAVAYNYFVNSVCPSMIRFDGDKKQAIKFVKKVHEAVKAACVGGPLEFLDTEVTVCKG